MNLVIDIGNTRIKLSIFHNRKMLYNEAFNHQKFNEGLQVVTSKYQCKNVIISSVGNQKLKKIVENNKSFENIIKLSQTTKVPFNNCYKSKETLGVDRIALVASAAVTYTEQNVLIIDAGTCITFDFIDKNANYYGGAISPGIVMRYKALHTFTDRLPLLEPNFVENLIGDSTQNSIHKGVTSGVISEIDKTIEVYKEKNEDLTVVLTGGDLNFLSNRLKNSIFANPYFLVEGLNEILIYNL